MFVFRSETSSFVLVLFESVLNFVLTRLWDLLRGFDLRVKNAFTSLCTYFCMLRSLILLFFISSRSRICVIFVFKGSAKSSSLVFILADWGFQIVLTWLWHLTRVLDLIFEEALPRVLTHRHVYRLRSGEIISSRVLSWARIWIICMFPWSSNRNLLFILLNKIFLFISSDRRFRSRFFDLLFKNVFSRLAAHLLIELTRLCQIILLVISTRTRVLVIFCFYRKANWHRFSVFCELF